MVYSKDKIWIVKQPKTYAGYRVVTFPPEIIAKIPKHKKISAYSLTTLCKYRTDSRMA